MKWKSVKDMKPPVEELVLVFNGNNFSVAEYIGQDSIFENCVVWRMKNCATCLEDKEITHWMEFQKQTS